MLKVNTYKIGGHFCKRKSIALKKRRGSIMPKYLLGVATAILSSQALLSIEEDRGNLERGEAIKQGQSISNMYSLLNNFNNNLKKEQKLDVNHAQALIPDSTLALIPKRERKGLILTYQQASQKYGLSLQRYKTIRQFGCIVLAGITPFVFYFGKEYIIYYFNSNRPPILN